MCRQGKAILPKRVEPGKEDSRPAIEAPKNSRIGEVHIAGGRAS
jgi:hypothetical protein